MSRIRAREAAFALLFEWESNKVPEHDPMTVLHESVDTVNIDENDLLYIGDLLSGCKANVEKLDAVIDRYSIEWRVERLPRADLALLRLAIYEIMFSEDVPDAAVIDQCVDLAKKYSTEESGAFINGVLGSVVRVKNEQNAVSGN